MFGRRQKYRFADLNISELLRERLFNQGDGRKEVLLLRDSLDRVEPVVANLLAEQDHLPGEADAGLAAEDDRPVVEDGPDDVEVRADQRVERIEGASSMEQVPT